MKISGDNLASQLTRGLGSIYLVSGDEPLLANEAADAIRARARKDGFVERDLHVIDGEFRLMPISKPRGWPDVITVFLRSLTENWSGKLIAVIVSGYDGDGAAALCGIKEVGGTTIAQKLDTALQPDMPESAIASGCIDFVLSPENIAKQIVKIAFGEPAAV